VISSTPRPTSKRANAYTVKHKRPPPNRRWASCFCRFRQTRFSVWLEPPIVGLAIVVPPISFPLFSVIRPFLPRLLLPVALAFGGAAAAAPENLFEQQYSLQVFQTDDGLPHNVAISVLQRPDGYLWVATNGGLARFDGVQFTALPMPAFASRRFAIHSMIAENRNTCLVGTTFAVTRLMDDGTMTPHPVTASLPKNQYVKSLLRESDGVFWIVFLNREAWRWADGKIERFPPPAVRSETEAPPTLARDSAGHVFLGRGLGVERYQAGQLVPLAAAGSSPSLVCAARGGGIWLASPDQILRLDNNCAVVATYPPPWSRPANLTAVMEDREAALWINIIGQGIKRWTPQGSLSLNSTHPLANDLFEDGEGNVWVSTLGGGLDCFRPSRCTLVAPSADWITDSGASVCEDAAGNLWYANRHGIRRIHGSTVEVLRPEDGWPKGAVPACADAAGNVWLAVGPRICIVRPGGQPPWWLPNESSSNIRALYVSRAGAVWAGRESGPLECYQNFVKQNFGPETGYPGGHAQAIGEDAAGHLWVGTSESGLFEWKDGHFTGYDAHDGLPNREIRVIHGDKEGNLWIGMVGGLTVRHQGRFYWLTSAQGLPGRVISQILEDDNGTLWFCTARGLFRLEKNDLLECIAGRRPAVTPVVYGKPDGIPGLSAIGSYEPTAWKTRAGRLWFATRKGLLAVDPAQIAANRNGPPVYLEHFLVDGHELEPGSVRFPSSAKRIEIKFTAPTFLAPEDVRFRYRLEGLDSDWSDPSTQRFAVYSSLRPGRYRFVVTACNSDLIWNPAGAALAFTITPMWWETWWARLAELVVAAVSLALAVRYWSHRRLKARLQLLQQEQRVELERKRIARDLHDGLGANLTQAGMVAEAMAEDGGDYTEMKSLAARLAEQVRGIARDLDTTVWAVSPKNDSLRSLCAYLCQFSIEYFRNSPVRCRVHAAENIPALPLSPETRHHLFMIARELMNNVLKHARASQVDLTTEWSGNCFILILADNGCGFSPETAAASDRNGLRNIRLRVAETGGKMDLQSSADGTTVRIEVPLDAERWMLRARHPAAI